MSHFWLKPDEQALMDSATATAHDYGYIGAFDLGTNTKTALKKLLGYEAKPEDQIRPHKLVNRTKFYVPDAKAHMSAKVLVRVSKAQALMLKMSHHNDSVEARFFGDPTGEFWGNLLVAQLHLPQTSGWGYKQGYGCRWHVINCLQSLMRGDGFGPTLERVANFADPLPENWRAAFVKQHFTNWHSADEQYGFYNSFKAERHKMPPDVADEIFNGIFDAPMTKCGQSWATQFWRECQDASYRARLGLV